MVQLLDHSPDTLELGWPPAVGIVDETAARRTLRAQIARLESELAACFVTAFEQHDARVAAAVTGTRSAAPRLLGLGELEALRDDLAARLHGARHRVSDRAYQQTRNRVLLERMRLDPASHKFKCLTRHDVGEPGCGSYRVKPRVGLIGMLMGWWHVKLSSGCPLAT